MTAHELIARWKSRQAEWRALHALVSGDAVASEIVADLERIAVSGDAPTAPPANVTGRTAATVTTWKERLWTSPADARLGVADVCEALGRPRSWVYRHTSPASGLPRIPHRKLDGELLFVAGEVRQWITEHEEVVVKAGTAVVPISRPRRPKAS